MYEPLVALLHNSSEKKTNVSCCDCHNDTIKSMAVSTPPESDTYMYVQAICTESSKDRIEFDYQNT